MFIKKYSKNIDVDKYSCGYVMGNYLIDNGLPLFGIFNEECVFVRTDKFLEVFSRVPKIIRFREWLHQRRIQWKRLISKYQMPPS